MRQGDGSDLPGVSSPRNAGIGIIYVAPSDDRQSVLAAILTQEKLGRKQIAIVLPAQNKAFQGPVDFDGLDKKMRPGLRGQIVFVAPGGSSPAELARQRRFPVYSSLENYAKSLQENGHSTPINRRGWKSPLSRQKPPDASSVSPIAPIMIRRQAQSLPNPADTPAPAQQAATKDDVAKNDPGTLVDAAGIVGATTVIDSGLLAADKGSSPSPVPTGLDDDVDALPPAAPIAPVQSATSSVQEDTATQEISGGLSSAASPASAKIIPISAGRNGATDKIVIPPITSIPAAQPQVPQVLPIHSSTTARQRTVGSKATPGMGAGSAATAGTIAVRNVRASGTPPPTRGAAGSPGGRFGRPRRPIRRGWLIALVALLVALLATCGTIAFAYPGIFSHLNLPIPGITSTATVTITPASKDVKNTYTIFGVTGNPDQALRQVQARQLTSTTPSQSKTANATGVGHTLGVQATGMVTLYNGARVDRLVSAGTTFTVGGGIQIVINHDVDVPAGNPPIYGVASVPAHAASVGSSGNIGALTINQVCCSSASDITARNLSAFSGGQDPQTFSVVQQSDIDGVVNPLKTMLLPAAQQSLQSQMQSSERFISTPQCSPNVNTNHSAGDHASTVTVTVKATCSGEVYNLQAAQTIAGNLLKQQAATDPGPGYALAGSLVVGVPKITLTNATKGTLELIVTAEGVWVYQFSDTQKAMLAKLIAGKSKQAAQSLLAQQMGVANADIQISGGDGKTLPSDPAQITINVLTVPGLQGTSPGTTPTTGPGSGTPTSPTAAPGAPTVTPTITPTVGLGSGG